MSDNSRNPIASSAALRSILNGKPWANAFIEKAALLVQQPDISKCTASSIQGSLIKAASFGFVPSEELGYCWITPRSLNTGTKDNPVWQKVATFQIGYKGWMELAQRSGFVESFSFATIRRNDEFKVQMGTAPMLIHNPEGSFTERGERVGVWAAATMRDTGRVVFHYCHRDEVERHQALQKDDRVWKQHTDIMWAKVAIGYLCKLQLPKSVEMQDAVNVDGAILESDGTVKTGAVEQIKQEEAGVIESELHEDWTNSIDAATTRDQLGLIYRQGQNVLKGASWRQFDALVRKRAKELENGTANAA